MVIAIAVRGTVEVGGAGGVGDIDERVQRERGGTVASRELVDERANSGRVERTGHGRGLVGFVGTSATGGFVGGGLVGVGFAGVGSGTIAGTAFFAGAARRRVVLSGRGSM